MENQDDLARYRELAKKWVDKTITPTEQEEFATWYNSGQDAQLDIPPSFAESEETHRSRILYKINRAIKYGNVEINNARARKWLSIAAAFIVMLCVPCAYFHIRKKMEKAHAIALQKRPVKNDIAPGSNKASLILSNGSKIALNDAKNGVLARQGKTVLNKASAGQLVYNAPATAAAEEVQYNTITTPKGGQYQVVLSDGSKVWLNAASSITFPTAFTGRERLVNITGEVYFEVAKNKKLPFRVVAGKQMVEVLGTHFDINAYSDESTIKTTLAEGSVKIAVGNKTVMLKPNQQAEVSNAGAEAISINTVDVDDILGWTNGNFVFEKAELPFIMRQAARWYNVNVKYEGNVAPRRFTGSISRNVNLSELLKMLKYTGVNFRVENQDIIVGS